MDQVENKKHKKRPPTKLNTAGIRVSNETKRDLTRLVDKINKKQLGKRVKVSEVVAIAIKLITDKHINELQQSSLSNSDKIEMQFKEYVRQHGAISKDDFLGMLHELMLSNMIPAGS